MVKHSFLISTTTAARLNIDGSLFRPRERATVALVNVRRVCAAVEETKDALNNNNNSSNYLPSSSNPASICFPLKPKAVYAQPRRRRSILTVPTMPFFIHIHLRIVQQAPHLGCPLPGRKGDADFGLREGWGLWRAGGGGGGGAG